MNDMAWAAGLFEGEGCITIGRSTSDIIYPRLQLAMNDEDIVRRFHSIVGVGTVYFKPSKNPKHGDTWVWRTGSFHHAQAVICMLWSYLGLRRTARAKEVLTMAKESEVGRQRHKYFDRRTTPTTLYAV